MAIPYRTAGQGYSGQTQAQMYYARKRRRAREGADPSEFKHVMPLGIAARVLELNIRTGPFDTVPGLGVAMVASIN